MSRFKGNWQWGRKRKIGRNRRTFHRLECLEDRTLLSSLSIVDENKPHLINLLKPLKL